MQEETAISNKPRLKLLDMHWLGRHFTLVVSIIKYESLDLTKRRPSDRKVEGRFLGPGTQQKNH